MRRGRNRNAHFSIAGDCRFTWLAKFRSFADRFGESSLHDSRAKQHLEAAVFRRHVAEAIHGTRISFGGDVWHTPFVADGFVGAERSLRF